VLRSRWRAGNGQALAGEHTRSCTSCRTGRASSSTRTSARRRRWPSATTSVDQGLAPGGPHAHGDRIGRDARPRAPLHRGRGFLPGAQRFAVEPERRPPQARAARHPLRYRQRHRSGLPLPRMALREGDDLEIALQKGFEALDGFYTFLMGHRKSWRSSATPSPASPPWWPKPTITSPSRPSSARWPTCRTSSTPTCSNRRPRRCTYGTHDLRSRQRLAASMNHLPARDWRRMTVATSRCSIRTARTTSRSG
jgi:hypothetical protein